MTPLDTTRTVRRLRTLVIAGAAFLAITGTARAGGGPENIIIIVDPSDAESMYAANYYRNARNVPDANLLFMDPAASNYGAFASHNLDAFLGTLANRGIDDHIDYVLIMPGAPFFISASPAFISEPCSNIVQVRRFAIASLYTMAFLKNDILAGLPVTQANGYYLANNVGARAFDNSTAWLFGSPSVSGSARKYYIGAMLGYTGARGNTMSEILAMVDRSVASDGTRPAGTFYYMQTTDVFRSPPRDPLFPSAAGTIVSLGGQAQHLMAVLPTGNHDCLGIMTGWASPDIDGANMTIQPGAFCDHLTSFAGRFDTSSQVKMSRWIAKGASGSLGAVEEPCNYPGKFPTARMHIHYFQGSSLGEAYFRSAQYVPFQMLLYGDPLTRPFAHLPTVSVPDAPVGPVSGTIVLTPNATTTHPSAGILNHDLYVDGNLIANVFNGNAFSLDTALLADGWHDVRVVSYDTSLVRSQGRWVGQIEVDNHGRSVSLTVCGGIPPPHDLDTLFFAHVRAGGGAVSEVRLLHGGRVVAAASNYRATFELLGSVFGAGPVQLVAEAIFGDGNRAYSPPAMLDISFDPVGGVRGDCNGDGVVDHPTDTPCFINALLGIDTVPPGGIARSDLDGSCLADGPDIAEYLDLLLFGGNHTPTAFNYTKNVPTGDPILVELPAGDREDSSLTYNVTGNPAQGTLSGTGPVRLLRPNPGAAGLDTITFTVNDGAFTSNTGTITIRYPDTTPPTPDPMAFMTPPTGISRTAVEMIAVTAVDDTPPVEYMFQAFSVGGTSSGWQTSSSYVDGGLLPNTRYLYWVRARDSAPARNTTAPSSIASGLTHIETPTGVSFGTVTNNSIALTANGAFTGLTAESSGLFFDSTTPGGDGGLNVWVQGTTATATGLQPNTSYTFRVKARNRDGVETGWGPTGNMTTLP